MYDILIPTTEKDFVKFRFTYNSIIQNLEGFKNIYCVSNIAIPSKMKISGVQYYLDKDVVDLDFDLFYQNIKTRHGWYVQQFIKLFQNVTSNDYLTIDSDVYFNKKIDIVEDGKPSFLFGSNQYYLPYFQLMKRLFDLDREYSYSFVNEMMFFKREIIQHLLSSMNWTKYGFFAVVVAELNRENEISGFSEYELYGNYVTKYFKGTYNYKYLKTDSCVKYRVWAEKEIQEYIDSVKGSDYDMITFHSWKRIE